LLKFRDTVRTVEVQGIEPRSFHRVMLHRDSAGEMVGYRDTLYWRTEHLLQLLEDSKPPADEMTLEMKLYFQQRERIYRELDPVELGMTMQVPPHWQEEDAPDAP